MNMQYIRVRSIEFRDEHFMFVMWYWTYIEINTFFGCTNRKVLRAWDFTAFYWRCSVVLVVVVVVWGKWLESNSNQNIIIVAENWESIRFLSRSLVPWICRERKCFLQHKTMHKSSDLSICLWALCTRQK